MSTTKDKLLQYLTEAQAAEQTMASTLRTHIAMTPRGPYRDDLEEHLTVTRRHAREVRERIGGIGWSFDPLALGAGIVESVVGQFVALGKAPLDLVRGMSLAEKLLKNAKEEYAGVALEIASYQAILTVAQAADDAETAELAARLRGEEEQFLERLRLHISVLAADVVAAEVGGRRTADVRTVGAADAARKTARRASSGTRRTTRQAAATGRRAARTARSTVRRESTTTRREPWQGYDEQPAAEIADRVKELPEERKERIREYEEQNKDRVTVVEAAKADQ